MAGKARDDLQQGLFPNGHFFIIRLLPSCAASHRPASGEDGIATRRSTPTRRGTLAGGHHPIEAIRATAKKFRNTLPHNRAIARKAGILFGEQDRADVLIAPPTPAKMTTASSFLGAFDRMFFTRIGKVIAHLLFWLGLLRVATGFLVAFSAADVESNRAAAHRYLAAVSSGEAIDEGMKYILLAVALGVLCEISSKKARPDEQA